MMIKDCKLLIELSPYGTKVEKTDLVEYLNIK